MKYMLQVRHSSGSRRGSRASGDLDAALPGGILKTPGGTSRTPGGLRRRSSRASRASGDLPMAKSQGRTRTVMFENVLFDEPEAQEVSVFFSFSVFLLSGSRKTRRPNALTAEISGLS